MSKTDDGWGDYYFKLWQEAKEENQRLRTLLERGVQVTRKSSGSWQDTYAWRRWTEDVEKELSDA